MSVTRELSDVLFQWLIIHVDLVFVPLRYKAARRQIQQFCKAALANRLVLHQAQACSHSCSKIHFPVPECLLFQHMFFIGWNSEQILFVKAQSKQVHIVENPQFIYTVDGLLRNTERFSISMSVYLAASSFYVSSSHNMYVIVEYGQNLCLPKTIVI